MQATSRYWHVNIACWSGSWVHEAWHVTEYSLLPDWEAKREEQSITGHLHRLFRCGAQDSDRLLRQENRCSNATLTTPTQGCYFNAVTLSCFRPNPDQVLQRTKMLQVLVCGVVVFPGLFFTFRKVLPSIFKRWTDCRRRAGQREVSFADIWGQTALELSFASYRCLVAKRVSFCLVETSEYSVHI